MIGETLFFGAPATCIVCGSDLKLGVYHSGAGYYVGSQCECGPYSRETGYFRTREEAEEALEAIKDGGGFEFLR